MVKLSFKKPKNQLESVDGQREKKPASAPAAGGKCPKCRKNYFDRELFESMGVCQKCGHHFRISARRRFELTLDEGSFTELFSDVVLEPPMDFPGYVEKLESLRAQNPGMDDAAVCGTGEISGCKTAVYAMEPAFLMGSMGTTVGEKITRLFEYAYQNSLPVVGFSLSGGARMQEGIFSLMQMAKTANAVKRHSGGGNLFISVMCDPTTGGVTASFASLGDIILAEPSALIGFAGPRVIEQTIRQKLPQGFQKAEFLLEKGFVDKIVRREDLRGVLSQLLLLHGCQGGEQNG